MILKKGFIGLFLLFGLCVQAQTVPLKAFLESSQEKFQIKFTYRDKDVREKTLSFVKLDTFEAFKAYFEQQTSLVLRKIDDQTYAIAKESISHSFCLQFLDNSTQLPISEIAVEIDNQRWYSNNEGVVAFTNNEKNLIVSITHPVYGFKEISLTTLTDCIPFFLEQNPILLDEVLINFQTSGVDKLEEGGFRIDPSKIHLVSGAINADVFTVLEKLPGVLNFDESIGDLHIHGGTPDQNQVEWNGIRLYQNAHVFGGITSVNPYGVDEIQFYKSGVRSLWGDHTGGLIRMQSGEKHTHPNIRFGLSLLDVNLGVPIKIGDNFEASLSGRSSLPNELELNNANPYLNQLIQNSTITSQNSPENENSYYDFTLSAKYSVDVKNTLYASAVLISDDFTYDLLEAGLETKESLRAHNNGYRIGWQYKNERFKSLLNLSNSNYQVAFFQNILEEVLDDEDDDDDDDYETVEMIARENNVNQFSLKWVGFQTLSEKSQLGFGLEILNKNIQFNRLTESVILNEALTYESNILNSKAIFVNYEHKNGNGLFINSGLRLNYYSLVNELTLEPRLSISKAFTNQLNIYLTHENKSQNAVQSQESVSSTIARRNPLWIGVQDGFIPLLKTHQQSLGVSYTKQGFIFDIEGFIKHWNGITTLNYGYIDPNDKDYHTGESKAKGVNMFVKKQGDYISLWGSYSLLDIKNKFNGINNNEWFTGNFNLKNSLKIGLDVSFKTFQLGTSYSYHTGMPYSEPLGTYYDESDGNLGFEYNTINGQYLPSYNRFDATAKYQFKLNPFKKSEIRASLINITKEKNILYKSFIYSESTAKILTVPTYSLEPTFNLGLFVEL